MAEIKFNEWSAFDLSRQIAEKPQDSFRIRFLPLPSKEE